MSYAPNPYRAEFLKQVYAMREAGWTLKKIADEVGRSKQTILTIMWQRSHPRKNPFQGLPPQVSNALCASDINTREDLRKWHDSKNKIIGIGKKGEEEIARWLVKGTADC